MFNFPKTHFKNNIFSFIFFIFALCLIIFPYNTLSAAKSGLKLWSTSVVPSLFPFFIATELLCHTNFAYILGKFFNILIKPLFNVCGEGSFAFIMGIISGYPVGAKIVSNFRENNICSKEECERLLSFTNNSGPLFIISTVGIGMYGSSTIGILLFFSHILACLTVGICFRFWKKTSNNITITKFQNSTFNNITLSNLGEIISTSISNAISTILMIGGFIILFSVIISILNSIKILNIFVFFFTPAFNILQIPIAFIIPFITGLLEITNGINYVSLINIKEISINLIFTSFLLGFGGFSILLQVLSIISKTDLSIKPYILGKILHGFFSALYTCTLIYLFPIFNFNL